jgi:hypothetical protein
VITSVFAWDLVGVQAMQGPVQQISTIRLKYNDDVPYGQGTKDKEMLGPDQIYQWYTGDEDPATGVGADTAFLEGRMGNDAGIEILREFVTAKSRKLKARYTIEAMQDASSQYDVNLESEANTMLSQEILAELDRELLSGLMAVAGTAVATYDQDALSGTANSVVDEHSAFAVTIGWVANKIAAETRRGKANRAVLSTGGLTVLESAKASRFVASTTGEFSDPLNNKYVGTLNNYLKCYVDTFAADTQDTLLGYKGNSEMDAGVFYCPYIPLMSLPTVMDPATGEYVTYFMSRYGYLALTNKETSLGNAGAYYKRIAMANLHFA